MKNNFFEILLTLFEKTLSQLKEQHTSEAKNEDTQATESKPSTLRTPPVAGSVSRVRFKSARETSIRVYSPDEQFKLTKVSHQFLSRLVSWELLSADDLEIVLIRLMFSETTPVTLEETKWTVRNTLAEKLDTRQLAFLDLILYQEEDGLLLH